MVNVLRSWLVLFTSLHLLHFTSSYFIVKYLPGFGELPFTLNTGYIGVGEREEVQLFYYFVESQRSPMNDPLLLWLIGGPGCTALSGFFYENGPLEFNYENFNGSFPELQLNPNTWSKVVNILYVDVPVGTGFSYSEMQQGYYSDDKKLVEHTYDFLHKWLVDHPKFQSNPLYIGGGSYAGIPIPPLVRKLYEDNKVGRLPLLNFKGYVLASPATDNYMDNNTKVEFAHQRTLISDELYESIKASCNGDYVNCDPRNTECMSDFQAFSELIRYIDEYDILQPKCMRGSYMSKRTLSEDFKNTRLTTFKCREDQYALSELWANDPDVRKALNVRVGTKRNFQRCNHSIAHIRNIPSVVDYHQELTNKSLRSLIYCGDLDMVTPHLSTHSMIKSFNLKLNITWHPWFVDGEVAGYTEAYKKNEYHLTYATVKGGGHVAQEHKPREVYEMIFRWFSYYEI